jgi:colanic acid/amylovoran biosynthesis protein
VPPVPTHDQQARSPRIVVEPSGHDLLNLGDTAMLQTAIDRLRAAWPAATIGVITANATALAARFPGVEPIPAAGRYELIDRGPPLPARRDRVLAAARAIGAGRGAAEAELGAPLSDDAARYLATLAAADLFVVSGRGGVCDAFHHESMHLLDEIEAASDIGLPVAMMGQGLGPVEHDLLRKRASEVLPRVDLLALREGRAAPGLARSLGVPDERVVVTGDDALELTLDGGGTRRAGSGIGVNLRVADYAAVDDADVARVGAIVRAVARGLSADLVGIPISHYPEEADTGSIDRMTRGTAAGGALDDVQAVVRRAAGCRVVVTGSYHAGLFALGQGVPVVGLARSGYYVDKLCGLAHQFGTGVTVLSLDDPGLEDELERAVRAWWDADDSALEPLPAAAQRQVEEGRAAWRRVRALLDGKSQRGRRSFDGPKTMVVDAFESAERDGTVELSARYRWRGADRRIAIAVPADLAADPADASPFLPLAILPAMRRGEDLVVDGPVSPRLLAGARAAAELYHAWAPELREPAIEVAEERVVDQAGPRAIACCYSLGVDSTYSAAMPRSHPGPLERLLFVRGLDPNLRPAVMDEEVRASERMAERMGIPLSVLATNVHDLTRLFASNWEDVVGAALASMALAAAGGLRVVVIPSTDSTRALSPNGTSPVLDSLFSTEATEMVHDSTALGRVEKTLWLARHRPDLLEELSVCFRRPGSDNCGRCGKCLMTMACLRVAGALGAARRFPDELDLDALRELRSPYHSRYEWARLARELDDGRDPALRELVLEILAKPAFTYPGPPQPAPDTPGFRARHASTAVSVLRDGLPWPPTSPHAAPPGLGLVRAVDRARGRHVYGVGCVPSGELTGELGSLPRDPTEGLGQVYLTAAGHLVTEPDERPAPQRNARAAARWVAAPLGWRGSGLGLGRRARAAVARTRLLTPPRPDPAVARVASIHRHPDPGRLALYSAIHPVTRDQLLTTNEWEPIDLGYGEPELLGYIDARAPVTGRLGIAPRDIPWAAYLGRRVRGPSG